MNKQDVLERIKALGLLAVIRSPSAELTLKMVEALIAGGVMTMAGAFTSTEVFQAYTLGADVVAVRAGSERCPPQLAVEGRFDEITRRAAEVVQVVQRARA